MSESRIQKAALTMSQNLLARMRKEKYWQEHPERQPALDAEHAPERKLGIARLLIEAIDAKAIGFLSEKNNGMWPSFWAAFTADTGLKLPKTQKGIAEVLRTFCGAEAYDACVSTKAKARAEAIRLSDAKTHQDTMDRELKKLYRYRMGGRVQTTVTARQMIDDLVSRGYRDISEEKQGNFPVLYLGNGGGSSFKFRRKYEMEYVRQQVAAALVAQPPEPEPPCDPSVEALFHLPSLPAPNPTPLMPHWRRRLLSH